MKIQELHIGMKVRHAHHGIGIVKSLTENAAEIRFDDATRIVVPEQSDLQPAEPRAAISNLDVPLQQLIEHTARAMIDEMGVERPDSVINQLASRWHKGKLELHPTDTSLQPKDVPLEVFFHKIVMVRNNLRVLEQKINSHEKLSDADKVEMQQYITRSYGSLTTFNLLFKNKEDQFAT